MKRERTVPEDRAEQTKNHDHAGEGRQGQPAVETRVGAVTGPARGDLRPVQAAIVKPEPEQQHV
ncbi:hypothetical protein [Bradyrhizobium japonicum]|uniref:hypothetical protein n=1 Tax=Bradyrhizobium japonicum TaxID=375 RepID=UPI00200ECC3B|nr:hypothetical protein [Bradyrhizobium japonicum]